MVQVVKFKYIRNHKSLCEAISTFNEELISLGFDAGSGGYPLYDYNRYSDFALAVVHNGEILSFMIYSEYHHRNDVVIAAAWTREDHRRKGFQLKLWKRLLEETSRSENFTIRGAFHKNNPASRMAQTRMGRIPNKRPDRNGFIHTTFKVEAKKMDQAS